VKQNKKEERNNQSWLAVAAKLGCLGAIVCLSSQRVSLAVFWANASFQYHPSVWSFDGNSLLQQISVRVLVRINIRET
jgi:hypothetical protein